MAMLGFALALLVVAADCWLRSPTFRAQRRQMFIEYRDRIARSRADRKFARNHRVGR